MLIIFAFFLILLPGYSQIESASFDLSTRYDNIDHGGSEDRLQERFRINASGRLSKRWSLKTLLATGKDYTSPWSTYHNFNEQENDQNFNVRQFYGEYNYEKTHTFQLGIIPPLKEFARTSLISSGWVEGASYNFKHKRFAAKATYGSIADLDQPSLFRRDRNFNYGKIKLDYNFTDHLVIRAGAANLDDDQYLQGEISYDFNDSLNVSAESLMNTDENVRNVSASTVLSPISLINKEWKDYLSIQLAYIYVDKDIGLLGTLADDFYTYGKTWFLGAGGKITKDNQFSWFLENWGNDEPRFNIGLMYRFSWERE